MKLPGLALCVMVCLAAVSAHSSEAGFLPGGRVLLDAHNCYPYQGAWADRIERALATGTPVGIEIDLAWHTDPATGAGRMIATHGKPHTGAEPGLREYFFEQVRPVVEKALQDTNRAQWPLLTLNINDIRGSDAELFQAVWNLLGEYEAWLCTAVKQAAPDPPAPLELKPVLVLTGGGGRETKHFYEQVPVGGKLRLFGRGGEQPATNFRRWLNYSWHEVEPEGQPKAADWTSTEADRLKVLVDSAHKKGYWVRFYTLNGLSAAENLQHGWGAGYNFGSLDAATIRWKAAREAGVDFIATDQYESFAAFLK